LPVTASPSKTSGETSFMFKMLLHQPGEGSRK
jgi:hypothetical protein